MILTAFQIEGKISKSFLTKGFNMILMGLHVYLVQIKIIKLNQL